ncbi:MAG: hypothetical protein SVE93_05145 [Candidatus Thermoplasmatota archaeon]|nr:hypothetical protein [Candidatus Thermoplasmatota archaeon]
MRVSRDELVGAFVHALGREAAEALMNRKVREAELPYKSSYDIKEIEKIVEELKKENALIRTLAMAFMAQARLRDIQSR